MIATQKVTTFLWFEDHAEEAAALYTSIFDDAKILEVSHSGEGLPRPAGSVMTVRFRIRSQEFIALNGGRHDPFNDAVSLFVACDTQEEVDRYWSRLSEGGREVQCGWLKDRYGLTWQVVPIAMFQYVCGPDPEGAKRAAEAMLQMKKLDLAALEKAYRGE